MRGGDNRDYDSRRGSHDRVGPGGGGGGRRNQGREFYGRDENPGDHAGRLHGLPPLPPFGLGLPPGVLPPGMPFPPHHSGFPFPPPPFPPPPGFPFMPPPPPMPQQQQKDDQRNERDRDRERDRPNERGNERDPRDIRDARDRDAPRDRDIGRGNERENRGGDFPPPPSRDRSTPSLHHDPSPSNIPPPWTSPNFGPNAPHNNQRMDERNENERNMRGDRRLDDRPSPIPSPRVPPRHANLTPLPLNERERSTSSLADRERRPSDAHEFDEQQRDRERMNALNSPMGPRSISGSNPMGRGERERERSGSRFDIRPPNMSQQPPPPPSQQGPSWRTHERGPPPPQSPHMMPPPGSYPNLPGMMIPPPQPQGGSTPTSHSHFGPPPPSMAFLPPPPPHHTSSEHHRGPRSRSPSHSRSPERSSSRSSRGGGSSRESSRPTSRTSSPNRRERDRSESHSPASHRSRSHSPTNSVKEGGGGGGRFEHHQRRSEKDRIRAERAKQHGPPAERDMPPPLGGFYPPPNREHSGHGRMPPARGPPPVQPSPSKGGRMYMMGPGGHDDSPIKQRDQPPPPFDPNGIRPPPPPFFPDPPNLPSHLPRMGDLPFPPPPPGQQLRGGPPRFPPGPPPPQMPMPGLPMPPPGFNPNQSLPPPPLSAQQQISNRWFGGAPPPPFAPPPANMDDEMGQQQGRDIRDVRDPRERERMERRGEFEFGRPPMPMPMPMPPGGPLPNDRQQKWGPVPPQHHSPFDGPLQRAKSEPEELHIHGVTGFDPRARKLGLMPMDRMKSEEESFARFEQFKEEPAPTPVPPASTSPKGASRFFDSLSVHIPTKSPATGLLNKTHSHSIIQPSPAHDPTKKLLFHPSPASSPQPSPPFDRHDSSDLSQIGGRKLQYDGYPGESPTSQMQRQDSMDVDEGEDANVDRVLIESSSSSSDEEDLPDIPPHMLSMSKAAILRAIKQIDESVAQSEERRDRLKNEIEDAARLVAKVAKQQAEAAEREAKAKEAAEKKLAEQKAKEALEAEARAAELKEKGLAAADVEMKDETMVVPPVVVEPVKPEPVIELPPSISPMERELSVPSGPNPLEQHTRHRLDTWFRSPHLAKQLEPIETFRVLRENHERAKQSHEYVETPYDTQLHRTLRQAIRKQKLERQQHHKPELSPMIQAATHIKELESQPFGLIDRTPLFQIQIDVSVDGDAEVSFTPLPPIFDRELELSNLAHHHIRDFPAWLTPRISHLPYQHNHHPSKREREREKRLGSGSNSNGLTAQYNPRVKAHALSNSDEASRSNLLASLHEKLKFLRGNKSAPTMNDPQGQLMTNELIKLTHPSNADMFAPTQPIDLFALPTELRSPDYDHKDDNSDDDLHTPLYTEPRESIAYQDNLHSFALKRNRVTAVIRAHRRAEHIHCLHLAAEYKDIERKWLQRHQQTLQQQHAQMNGLKPPNNVNSSPEVSVDGRRASLRSRQSSDGLASPTPSAYQMSSEAFQATLDYYTSLTSSSTPLPTDLASLVPIPASTLPPDEDQKRLRYLRCTATLPPLLVDERERAARAFDSRNGLVLDAMAEERAFKQRNPWTEAEKRIFERRFLKHPKQFRKIATFLPNKNVNDCVSYYYYSKLTVNYKKLLRAQNRRNKKAVNSNAGGGYDSPIEGDADYKPNHDKDELAHANNPYAHIQMTRPTQRGGLALMAPPLTGEQVLAAYQQSQQQSADANGPTDPSKSATAARPPGRPKDKNSKSRGLRELCGLAVEIPLSGSILTVNHTTPGPTSRTTKVAEKANNTPLAGPMPSPTSSNKESTAQSNTPIPSNVTATSSEKEVTKERDPLASPVKERAAATAARQSMMGAPPVTPTLTGRKEKESTTSTTPTPSKPRMSQKREREKSTSSRSKNDSKQDTTEDDDTSASEMDEDDVSSVASSGSESVGRHKKRAKKTENEKTESSTKSKEKESVASSKGKKRSLSDVDEETSASESEVEEEMEKPNKKKSKKPSTSKSTKGDKAEQPPSKKQKITATASKPTMTGKTKPKPLGGRKSSQTRDSSPASSSSSSSSSESSDDEEAQYEVHDEVEKSSTANSESEDEDEPMVSVSDEDENDEPVRSDEDEEMGHASDTSSRGSSNGNSSDGSSSSSDDDDDDDGDDSDGSSSSDGDESDSSSTSSGGGKSSISRKKEKERKKDKKHKKKLRKDSDGNLAAIWSNTEREAYISALTEFGKNWSELSRAVGSKPIEKCKNFFNNNKVKLKLQDYVDRYEERIAKEAKEKRSGLSSSTTGGGGATNTAASSLPTPIKQREKSGETTKSTATTTPTPSQTEKEKSTSASQHKPLSKSTDSKSASITKPAESKSSTDKDKSKEKSIASISKSSDKDRSSSTSKSSTTDKEKSKSSSTKEKEKSKSSSSKSENKKKSDSSSSTADASSSSLSTTPGQLSRDDPLSWTNAEKQQLFRAIQIYGKQWDRITSMVGSRTQQQVEGFYKKYKIKLNLQEMVHQAEELRRGNMKQSPTKGRKR